MSTFSSEIIANFIVNVGTVMTVNKNLTPNLECAIQAMASECAHCGCKVIGHGVEADGAFFCCGHCASQQSARGVAD